VVAVKMREEDGVDVAGLDVEETEIVEQSAADDAALPLSRGRDTDKRRARTPGKIDKEQLSSRAHEEGAEAHYEEAVVV
jgi:hypothetical protein